MTGQEPITVVIVDDHPVVRAGMRSVLDRVSDFRVLAEGQNGREALSLVRAHKPRVLVLDINLPDMTGLDVAQVLRREGEKTAILALTAHDDVQTALGILECGALGYVLKDEALEALEGAVRAAAKGESWLSPGIARYVIQKAVGEKAIPDRESGLDENLTPREMEILCLLARGLDNTAIAETLTITKRTVQNHVSSIYGKLGLSSRTEAVLYALRQGWVNVGGGD